MAGDKRYVIFSGTNFDADGGAHDIVDSSPTEEEARDKLDSILNVKTSTWAHIYDTETGEIIEDRSRGWL